MEQVTDKSLGSWTRTKNDNPNYQYESLKNAEMFQFITYSPDYLQEGSCVSGNSQNCNVFRPFNVDHESRIGKLTNLNEIQRATTNDTSLGIRTTPDLRSGEMIDPRLIQDMSNLESTFEGRSRLNIPPTSLMNEHHIDEGLKRLHPDPFPRNAVRVSTRAVRRNAFAEQCDRI